MSSSSPTIKKKMKIKAQEFISLPDELVLNCLARVSRLYYPTYSLVCKSFRALIASPELYQTRSVLGRTESCLYRPFSSRTIKKKSTGNLLVPIPSPHFPSAKSSRLVAVDSKIYEIGGVIEGTRSSRVSILDCRYHTWHEGPSMQTERCLPAADVLDGKIYVAGGVKDNNSLNWMEVFDPKQQTWEPLSSTSVDICGNTIIRSTQIDGKLYIYGEKAVVYNHKEGTCEAVPWMLSALWHSSCVIDNVLYGYNDREFKWYDTKSRLWRRLIGLEEGLPKFVSYSCVKLVGYNGKMVVFWDKYAPSSGYKEKMIWCAEIALERCSSSEEILGKVEWFDAVLKVPKSYEFVCALSAIV